MSSVTLEPTFDGRCGREGANEAWGPIIGNNGNASGTALAMRLATGASTPGTWGAMRRGLLRFNPGASPLPTGALVSAVTLNLFLNGKSDKFSQSFGICQGVIGGGSVSNSDYEGTNSTRTEWATRKTIASLTGSAYNAWTFNAAGIAAVQAAFTGSTTITMALRYSGDIDQSSPTNTGVLNDVEDNTFNGVTAGGGHPQLVVTYRIGPGHAVVSLTGTLGNSGDSLLANFWVVEVYT